MLKKIQVHSSFSQLFQHTKFRLNLSHIISDMMEQEEQEEIHDFFKETENFSFEEARKEFEEDEFTDEEIRLLRIDFISKVAN